MVLFTILMIALIILAVVVTLTIGIGGALAIVVFGDIIICITIIALIVKLLTKRRK